MGEEWINEKILPSVIKYLKSNANLMVNLPAGSDRNKMISKAMPTVESSFTSKKAKLSISKHTPPQEPLPGRWIPPPRPKVRFIQKDGEQTCVYSSFASCLYYQGKEDLAEFLMTKALKNPYQINNMERLYNDLNAYVRHCNPNKKSSCVKRTIYKKGSNYDLMNQSGQDIWYPTIFVLQATDGNSEHAVTILGYWVFDSNLESALPLTVASLDWCVMGRFERVLYGHRYYI